MTMSLRDVDAIDYIGVNVLFKRVYVALFDDLDWREEQAHQKALTKKIDRYISYFRSGQLLLNYPKVRGYEIVIEYVSTHPMTPTALEFWKTRERVIADAGYKVHIRGVDVRRSLGIAVEEPKTIAAEPVEPPALDVLGPAPIERLADISYLPPLPPRSRRKQPLPLLSRLAMRQAAI
ncbi:DUF6572 domain-containing protein [Caballeronia ptereochthonis]|uniref:Uncharacterized protein n=1 Tax=Caballeronia ptereochthonis TaxID=1777144 RepID=A0A158AUN2_9BURK|nr:DUF6572 domain-containing protein [Caballeronia ptereochthonis]SAK61465.1 hypothetical protein AWB83_02379 [Caballeronia ptereochthonis]